MFLNYMAGAVSLVLAISAFIPWVTVWFYSLKGIESAYGIGILVVGVLGVAVSVFQHLSGKMRGRAFIFFSLIALTCEGLYFRKMSKIGATLNEIVGYLTDVFGSKVVQKVQLAIGEEWTKILGKLVQRVGIEPTVNGFDFVGNGLVLATVCTVVLFAIGILLEKNKTIPD